MYFGTPAGAAATGTGAGATGAGTKGAGAGAAPVEPVISERYPPEDAPTEDVTGTLGGGGTYFCTFPPPN